MPDYNKEYLVGILPTVDKAAWNREMGTISGIIKKATDKFDAEKKLQKQLKQVNKEADALDEKINVFRNKYGIAAGTALSDIPKDILAKDKEFSGLVSQGLDLERTRGVTQEGLAEFKTTRFEKSAAIFNKSLGAMSHTVSAAASIFSMAKEKAEELAEAAKEFSNEFVTASSIFVDSSVKSTMAQFGVSSEKAQAYNTVLGELGLTTSDIATMTQGQTDAMNKLMGVYEEGLKNINPDKLKRFNESVQEYQYLQAEFNVKMKTAVMQLLAESDALPEMLDTLESFMDKVIGLLSSDAAQFAFDTFISFLDTILSILSVPLQLFGGGNLQGSTTNNNTSTTHANIYVTANNASSNIGEEIALELQKANS